MKEPIRPQSRLLLRLALYLEEGKDLLAPRGSLRHGYKAPEERKGLEEETARGGETERVSEPETLTDSTWQRLESLRSRFEAELGFADEYLFEDHPSSRIQMVLENSSPLRKVAILQRFVERAYGLRLHRPHEGLRIADQVIDWTRADLSPLVAVIRCRALLERGNFLRILDDPDGARAALAQAATEMEANDSGDPLELARHQELLGALEGDCGRFDLAARLLGQALSKIRRWGDQHTLQRVLIAAGMMEITRGRYEEAETLLEEALRTDADTVLMRYAFANRIFGYYDSGDPLKAYTGLLRVRAGLGESWRQPIPERVRTRQEWIEGQILTALRIEDEAIDCLKEARKFYIRTSLGFEVYSISIDLAINYAAGNQLAKVEQELAFGLSFCSNDNRRENYARETGLVLKAALEHQGRLEVDQLRTISRQLEVVQRAPLQAQWPPVQLQL